MSSTNDEIKRRLADKLKQKTVVSGGLVSTAIQPKKISKKAKSKIIYSFLIFLLILIPVSTFTFVVQSFKTDEKPVNTSREQSSSQNSSVFSTASVSSQNSMSVSSTSTKEILPPSSILEIPLVRQIYTLSCEAATLEMALKYYGVNVSQDQLLSDFGVSEPMVMQTVNNKVIWGDPDEAFVGNVKGNFTGTKDGVKSLRFGTGLGINNGPVSRVARKYKPLSQELDAASTEQIKLALVNKNPVMFWHRRDDIHQESMEVYTRSGKKVTFQQYHVNLIIGYKTNLDGTVMYIMNDPIYGRIELSENDLVRWWGRYNKEIAIIK